MKNSLKYAVCMMTSLVFVANAWAQKTEAWPSKNVRILVPYAAGGPADLVARELAQVLANDLKQSVTVENMGGAMGVPALSAVARAEADGHTLLLSAMGNMVLQPILSKHGGGELIAKLKPIGTVSTAPHVLVVSSKLPIKTVPELIDYAKANPGRISFASAGTGGTAHLGMEMFKSLSGTDVLHVPYKGSSGSVNDLISGQVSVLFSSLPSLQGVVDKGYVRILAATSASSSPATKNLPLMSAALPGFDYATWYAMYAPVATSKELSERINKALNQALKNPKLVEKVEAAGTELHPGTPEEAIQWTKRDVEKWTKVIQTAKISLE
jgi:tripartite-type tricarboxylate transporter receptor subunit TctC|nr:tripartite tricarboxylate transporter substrate binding protein [uncultured Limnohabitans sp.]